MSSQHLLSPSLCKFMLSLYLSSLFLSVSSCLLCSFCLFLCMFMLSLYLSSHTVSFSVCFCFSETFVFLSFWKSMPSLYFSVPQLSLCSSLLGPFYIFIFLSVYPYLSSFHISSSHLFSFSFIHLQYATFFLVNVHFKAWTKQLPRGTMVQVKDIQITAQSNFAV